MKFTIPSSQKGFTLVEMIIALGIFAIVAIVAVGALLRITDANKKAQSLKTAINNLNFALESMSREMRVGGNYACGDGLSAITINDNSVEPNDCDVSSGDWFVAFNSSKTATYAGNPSQKCNLIHAYGYSSGPNGTITKYEQKVCDDAMTFIDQGEFLPLLSPDVKITNSILRVAQGTQPAAFFWMKGYTGEAARQKTEFELQTSISQRVSN